MNPKLSNLTRYVEPENELKLKNLYELLICVPVKNFIFGGKSLPFFGVNDIIVSVKSVSWGSRGARCITASGKTTGALKSSISIDYQFDNKNNNMKVFRTVVQIAGLSSEEEGNNLISNLSNYLKILDKTWMVFYSLSESERIELIETYVFPIIIDENNEMLTTSDEKLIESFKKIEDEFKENDLESLLGPLRFLISFLDFHPTFDEFKEKMKTLIYLEVNNKSVFTESGILNFSKFRESRGIYNTNVPYDVIVLGYVTSKLREMNFDASFSNEKSKDIKIISYTNLDDGKLTPETLIHQTTVSHKGTIKVISPGESSIVINEIKRVSNVICEIIESEDYPKISTRAIQNNIKMLLSKKDFISLTDIKVTENQDIEQESDDELL